jgi:hypothetical protein
MELNQRRLFSRQQFKCDENTLHISTWSLFTGTKDWSVRLDEIGFRYDVRQMGIFSNGCLFAVAIVIISTLVIIELPLLTALIVLIISMTPLILGRTINSYNYMQIPTRRGTVLIGYSKKEKLKADEFIVSLKETIKKYMIWKYGTIDPDLNFQKQVENFWWLRNNEIITEDEYAQLKSKLKEDIQKSQTK